MFCSQCGKGITDDTKFCPACGAQAEAPEAQSQVPGPDDGNGGSSFSNIGKKAGETFEAGKEKAEAFVKENLNKEALKANAEKAGAFIKGNANKEGVKAGAAKARGLINRLPVRGLLERVIPQAARAKVPLLNPLINLSNYITLALAAVVVISIVTPSGGGKVSGRSRQAAPFHGEWLNISGTLDSGRRYAPYTVTIGRDFFHFADTDGYGYHIANPVWVRTENPRSNTRADFPDGYILSGSFSHNRYSHVPDPFVAMSRDGRLMLNIDTFDTASFQIIFVKDDMGNSRDARAFHGTWGNDERYDDGTIEQFAATISVDNLHHSFTNREGVLLFDNMANPLWVPAPNPREDTRADFPNGFIIEGPATNADGAILNLSFFVALNRNGQMLLNYGANFPDDIQRIFNKTGSSTARPALAPLPVSVAQRPAPAPFANTNRTFGAPAAAAGGGGGGGRAAARPVFSRVDFNESPADFRVYDTEGRSTSGNVSGRPPYRVTGVSGDTFTIRSNHPGETGYSHYNTFRIVLHPVYPGQIELETVASGRGGGPQ